MEAVLIFAVIVGGALFVRRLRGGKSADVPAFLAGVSDRPTATRWEKGVASDLLDQIALDDARASVIAKLQRATGSAPVVAPGTPAVSAEAPVVRQPVA